MNTAHRRDQSCTAAGTALVVEDERRQPLARGW